MDPSLATKGIKEILAIAGLPDVRLHDLRHTTATLLMEHGVPDRVISDILGHSSVYITQDVYSHVTARLSKAAVDAMEALRPILPGSVASRIAAQITARDSAETVNNPDST